MKREIASLPFDEDLKRKLLGLAFWGSFAAILAFNIWKAPFGTIIADESLYLAIPYRLLQGDRLAFHEWNSSQLSAVLLLPLVKAYLAAAPNTDGIFLCFRYVYVFFHAMVSIYIYAKVRHRNGCAAAIAAAFYQLFCYSNIMAPCYNTMGIGLMIVACLTMYNGKGRPAELALAGLALSGAVLCCPYLVLVYLIYTLAVLGLKLCGRSLGMFEATFSIKSWLTITLTCGCLAAAFLIYLLSGGESEKLLEIVPVILVDEDHPARGVLNLIGGFLRAFYQYNGLAKPFLSGMALWLVVYFADKKRLSHRAVYLLLACVLTFVFSYTYLFMYREPNYMMFPPCVLGLFAFLMCKKRDMQLFALMYIPGFLYMFCMYASSNLLFGAISGAATVSMIAGILFIFQLLEELRREKCAFCAMGALSVGLVLLTLFGGLFFSRMEKVTFDAPPRELSTEITQGSAKGLKTTPDKAWAYEQEYLSLAPLREIREGNVIYFTEHIWHYVEDEKRSAAFSTWLMAGSQERRQGYMDKFEQYWSWFPDKMPDYVYIPAAYMEDEEFLARWDRYEYELMPLEYGTVLCIKE